MSIQKTPSQENLLRLVKEVAVESTSLASARERPDPSAEELHKKALQKAVTELGSSIITYAEKHGSFSDLAEAQYPGRLIEQLLLEHKLKNIFKFYRKRAPEGK